MSLCSLPRESLNDITTGNIIRNVHWIRNVHVYHDVFKVGNTAGEYTECGSSPHEALEERREWHDMLQTYKILKGIGTLNTQS
jgi:hypothetical protein